MRKDPVSAPSGATLSSITLVKTEGFETLRPAEAAPPPVPVHELTDEPDATWTYRRFWKAPSPEADAIGVHWIENIALWSPGFATHLGRFIDDGSVPAGIAYAQAQARASELNVADPTIPARRVDRPALLVGGPGHAIWGHWIAEFLPSVAIARTTLGPTFDDCVIPLPTDTPDWVTALLVSTCGVDPRAIVRYQPGIDYLRFSQAIKPTFGFTGEYTFHGFVRDFYDRLRLSELKTGLRLCLSRSDTRYADSRPFPLRDRFEAIARERGFEIIRPETCSVPEQIDLFGDAAIVIGEYGSAMHNTVFAKAGTIVGCIGHWNAVQMRLGELFRQPGVYLTRGCHWPTDQAPMRLDVSEADLESFVDLTVSLSGDQSTYRGGG